MDRQQAGGGRAWWEPKARLLLRLPCLFQAEKNHLSRVLLEKVQVQGKLQGERAMVSQMCKTRAWNPCLRLPLQPLKTEMKERKKREFPGSQWLGLCVFTAEDLGSISGPGTKIPQATWWPKEKKEKKEMLTLKYCSQCTQFASSQLEQLTGQRMVNCKFFEGKGCVSFIFVPQEASKGLSCI